MSTSFRHYLIPTVSALGMTLTAGCSDTVVGEWTGEQYRFEGTLYSLPQTYTSDEYDVAAGLWLTIDEELEGTLSWYSTYSDDGGEAFEYVYDYALTAEETARLEYVIELEALDFTLDCALEATGGDDTLACAVTGDDADIESVQFGRDG